MQINVSGLILRCLTNAQDISFGNEQKDQTVIFNSAFNINRANKSHTKSWSTKGPRHSAMEIQALSCEPSLTILDNLISNLHTEMNKQ